MCPSTGVDPVKVPLAERGGWYINISMTSHEISVILSASPIYLYH